MIEISEADFNIVTNIEGVTIVDCYTTWCGPCKQLAKELSKVTTCQVYKLDIEDNLNIASEYNIMSVPTLLFFNNGKLAKKTVGLMKTDAIENIIASLVGTTSSS